MNCAKCFVGSFNSHNESMQWILLFLLYHHHHYHYSHLQMRKQQQDMLCNWRPPANKCSAKSWTLISDLKACALMNSAHIPSSASLSPLPPLILLTQVTLYITSYLLEPMYLTWETCDRMSRCVNTALRFSPYEFFLFTSINNLGTNSLCINHFLNNWYDMKVNPSAICGVRIF